MRDLGISGIIIGIICSVMAVIMVLSGGKFLVVAEGWSRAANLAFLFSIACSLLNKDDDSSENRKENPSSAETDDE